MLDIDAEYQSLMPQLLDLALDIIIISGKLI